MADRRAAKAILHPAESDVLRTASASGGRSGERIYEAVIAQLEAAGSSGSALDFGAGRGELSRRLCERGAFSRVVAVDVVDYDSEDPAGLERVWSDLNRPTDLAEESFDALAAVGVIEYLENPRFVAREWFRLLKPGGILVATTLNNESWRAIVSLVVRGHFAGFADGSSPAQTALTRKDLQSALAAAGFDGIRFFYTDRGGVPGRPALTWQRMSLGLLRGRRYSDDLGCVARKPSEAGANR